MYQRFATCSLFFALLVFAAALPAWADAGKDLFDKQCSSCHTIGGGDGGGPDLKGVGAKHPAEWLVRVISEPDKLTAEKDPAQAELVKKFGMEMPNLGVSKDDAQKIVAFLNGGAAPAAPAAGASAAPAAPAAEEPKKDVVVTKELLAQGLALFTGKTAFSKGGPPCVSCHSFRYPGVNGGALAADLTGLYGKMGENGVRGVLKGLNFPVMKKAYADRGLTEEETTALIAFFKDASEKDAHPSDSYPPAALGFLGVLVVAAIVFKRRIS